MPSFILPLKNQTQFAVTSKINLFPPQIVEFEDQKEGVSYLGTPIYGQLILDPKNTGLAEGRLDPETKLDAGALALNEVLITIAQSKNIVTTPIAGRNGTIKEYIALGDYQITARGYLVSKNPNEYPAEDLIKLKRFGDLQKQLVVASNILSEFRITSMVIASYTVDQQAGFRNRVPFVLNCISDDDEEIILSANANT